jgi:hypothetical protein
MSEHFYADPVANDLALLTKRFDPGQARDARGRWVAGLGSLADKLGDAGYGNASGHVQRAMEHASSGDMTAAHRSLAHARDAVRSQHARQMHTAPRVPGEVRPGGMDLDSALRGIEQARTSAP